MVDQHHKEDYSLAQKICKHLKACRNDAILELYHDHHRFFLAFTRLRLFNPEHDQIEAVVSNFWMELLNGKAICSYQGKASLRTYLLTILNRRIIDANRRFQRELKYTEIAEEQNIDASNMPEDQRSAEDYVLQKERRKLIHDALIQLSETSPRDAKLVRMHLNGLSYKSMAEQEINGNESLLIEKRRRINAIKKQFTRPNTGSLAKFKSIIEENIQKHEMDRGDFLI